MKNELILPDGSKLEMVLIEPFNQPLPQFDYNKYFIYTKIVSAQIQVNMLSTITIQNSKIISSVRIYNSHNPTLCGDYKAIWDTGAIMTHLSPKIVSDLQLTAMNSGNTIDAAGNEHQTTIHAAAVKPDGHTKTFAGGFALAPRDYDDFDLIIGMDIIMGLKLTIDNNTVTIES